MISIMFQLRPQTKREGKLLIFESLFQSRINYLFIGCAYKRNNNLKYSQVVQNKALKKTLYKDEEKQNQHNFTT